MKRPLALLALILFTLIVDQGTKVVVRATLRHHAPRQYGPLMLVYAENPGAFMSLGSSLPRMVRRVIFDGIVAVGLAIAAWFLFSGRAGGRDEMALALIVGGGVGNLIDRFRFGGMVTDFLYLSAGPLHTGVFNVADLAITAGVVWWICSALVRRGRTPVSS